MGRSRIPRAAVAGIVAACGLLLGSAPAQTFVTWPQPVNPGAATDSLEDSSPAVISTASGHVIASWRVHGGAPGPALDELRVSRSPDWGGTWSTPLTLDAALVADPAAPDGHASLAADSAGKVIITWQRGWLGLPSLQPSNILVATSSNDGQSWSPLTPLTNSSALTDPQNNNPSIATDGSGCWIVVYSCTDSLGGTIGADTDIFFARSTNDGASWTTACLNTDAATDTDYDHFPRIATDGTGHWIATWERDQQHLYIARSSDDGATWSTPQLLWTEAGIFWFSIDLAAGPVPGRWLLAWGSVGDILISRSDDAGASWSPPQSISGSGMPIDHGARITCVPGQPALIAWHRQDSSSAPVRLATARSSDGGLTWSAPADLISIPAFNQGTSRRLSVAGDPHGNWLLAWQYKNDLFNPDYDILFTRGVGPSPTASLNLSATNPTPTSYQIAATNMGFTPGRTFFTCFTLQPGAYPYGAWFGIDPRYDELITQLTMPAPPFNGTFDAAGNSTFSVTWWSAPGPLGMTLRAVTLEHTGGAILRASPPIESSL